MATITTGSFSKALWPGVNKWYEQDYNDWQEEYSQIFDVHSSRKNYEEDVGVSGFGLASEKSEGDGIDYDDAEQNFMARYTHKVYAKGFKITREMVEDDLYDVIGKQRARALARSLRQTKETVGANILNRAFNSSHTMGGDHDGVELLSTAHVGGPYQATYSNKLSTDADLSEASLEDLLIQIAGATDPRGLKIQLQGMKLIIPRQLEFIAHRILASTLQSGTGNNDVNALNSLSKLPQGVCINHYLTDSDAWFIKTNAPDGLKCFQRRKAEFTADNSFDTENAKFKATERYAFGWSDPRGLYGTQGA